MYEYPRFRGTSTCRILVHGGLRSDGGCRRRSAHQAIRQSHFSNNVPDFHIPPTARLPQSPQARHGPRVSTRGPCGASCRLSGMRAAGQAPRGNATKGPNVCVAPHKLLSPPSGCQPVAPSLFSSLSDERAITFRLLSRYQYEVPIPIPTTCTYDKQNRQTRPTAAVHRVSGLAFSICCVA